MKKIFRRKNAMVNSMKRYDKRFIDMDKDVIGTAVAPNDKGTDGELQIFVRKRRKSHNHLHNQKIDDLTTKVIEVGDIEALGYTDRVRPVPSGVSVSNINGTAGSAGCLVLNSALNRYLLSCAHTIGRYTAVGTYTVEYGVIGDSVVQPGIYDGGSTTEDIIGTVANTCTLNRGSYSATNPNYIDAMLCDPVLDHYISDEIIDFVAARKYRTISAADVGRAVAIVGRSTGYATGTITGISGLVSISYPFGNAYFDNQIVTSAMGEAGDSGALLVDLVTNEVLGMLIAGNASLNIFNRMSVIFSTLSLSFGDSSLRTFSDRYKLNTLSGYTWGDSSPDDGELSREWAQPRDTSLDWYSTTYSRAVYSDSEYGKLYLTSGEEAVSYVVDTGNYGNELSILLNKYGSGSGTYTLYIRGSQNNFAQNTSPSTLAWEVYTTSIERAWRYVQLRLVAD